MKKEDIILRIDQISVPVEHTVEEVVKKAKKTAGIRPKTSCTVQIIRRSIDARKRPDIRYVYSVDLHLPHGTSWRKSAHARLVEAKPFDPFRWNINDSTPRVAVIGSGPAGLFAAYLLALNGFRPMLFERGQEAHKRLADVTAFWESGKLKPDSNVQFGEGGAGTFSDGKLNTRVNDKSGRNRFVLETFVRFGAKEEILYDAAPHVGTDRLITIVTNLRKEIVRLGGTVRFGAKVTGLELTNKTSAGFSDINSLKPMNEASVSALYINDTERIPVDACILAIGHSARDTFRMLNKLDIPMEPKPFAVGFRVEHPQKMINESQYGTGYSHSLPPAAYKLTHKASNGRSVYSFCMCPGGYVVNSSSGEKQTVVNGMSYSGRNSANANSAVVVSVSPDDFPGTDVLSGIDFQEALEEKSFQLANGSIPQQLYGDYRQDKESPSYGAFSSCVKGSASFCNLRGLLPADAEQAFLEGMESFGKKIRGFDREDAILSSIESRTSSPVRILRNEHCESHIKGLYPCGEGAGYAGGITSAAMDGLKCAEALMNNICGSN